jgi:hypothetical protein
LIQCSNLPRKLSATYTATGVESAEKLKELFTAWYGSLPSVMYRNWFKVLGVKSETE